MRQLRGSDGAEIAEAALVLPIVFTFLLGIVWFGRAFQIYSTITQAAQKGAVTAARPTCATCTEGGWAGTAFPADTAVESAVFGVMDAASLDRNLIGTYVPSGTVNCADRIPPLPVPDMDCPHTTGNKITVCRSVQLTAAVDPPQCGVIVSFQYPFQMNLPFTSLNMQTINLKAQAQSRMEN